MALGQQESRKRWQDHIHIDEDSRGGCGGKGRGWGGELWEEGRRNNCKNLNNKNLLNKVLQKIKKRKRWQHAYKHNPWTQTEGGVRVCAGWGGDTARERSMGEQGDT